MQEASRAVVALAQAPDPSTLMPTCLHTNGPALHAGTLEAKPLAMLLAPHCARRFADELAELVANNGMATSVGGETTAGHAGDSSQSQGPDIAVVGMHYDRVAFPVKLSLRKASGAALGRGGVPRNPDDPDAHIRPVR